MFSALQDLKKDHDTPWTPLSHFQTCQKLHLYMKLIFNIQEGDMHTTKVCFKWQTKTLPMEFKTRNSRFQNIVSLLQRENLQGLQFILQPPMVIVKSLNELLVMCVDQLSLLQTADMLFCYIY